MTESAPQFGSRPHSNNGWEERFIPVYQIENRNTSSGNLLSNSRIYSEILIL